jgi:hypothetical protein
MISGEPMSIQIDAKCGKRVAKILHRVFETTGIHGQRESRMAVREERVSGEMGTPQVKILSEHAF